MKFSKLTVLSSALCLATTVAQAQASPEVEQLKKQLQQMQQNFERIQLEQKQQIDALQKQLEQVAQKQTSSLSEQEKLKEQMKMRVDEAAQSESESAETKAWRPTDPIRIGKGGAAYMDIGLVGTFVAGGSTSDDIGGLQIGGHDPTQNGLTLQGVELSLTGAVDPYFRGAAAIVFALDAENETFVELEEAWLETTSLPGNLQLRAGQMFTEFGRHNVLHPHSWAFVDSPLVNARLLGPEALRNPGARLSWLTPTPFYSELFLSVQNSQGGTAASFRSSGAHQHGGGEDALPFAYRHPDNDQGVEAFDDLLLTPRYALSFDFHDTHTVLAGASAAFGPNSSGESGNTDTQIYGVDLTWKWKPVSHEGGFPFVTWQTEGILRKYKAGAFDWDEGANGGDADGDGLVDEGILVDASTGLPATFAEESLTDYGFYTQLLYGFKKGWVAGLRFDYLTGDRGDYERPLLVSDGAGGGDIIGRDPLRDQRWRVSPNLTWFPTEFSKLRLQYNYDDRRDVGVDHSVWLQFEFVLGAHAAHKF